MLLVKAFAFAAGAVRGFRSALAAAYANPVLLDPGAASAAWRALPLKAANVESQLDLSGKWGRAKDALSEFRKQYGKEGPRGEGMATATLDARTLPCSSVGSAKPKSCWRRFATTLGQ